MNAKEFLDNLKHSRKVAMNRVRAVDMATELVRACDAMGGRLPTRTRAGTLGSHLIAEWFDNGLGAEVVVDGTTGTYTVTQLTGGLYHHADHSRTVTESAAKAANTAALFLVAAVIPKGA